MKEENLKLYECFMLEDNDSFAVGTVCTEGEWKEVALNWARNDNSYGICRELSELKRGIIEYINLCWNLNIKEKGNCETNEI